MGLSGTARASLIALLTLASPEARAQSRGPSFDIPRGAAPRLDGVVDSVEWRGAARVVLPGGGTLHLLHDGGFLYLGIRSAGNPLGSVCVREGDRIRILHASMALGSVWYRREDDGAWRAETTAFAFGMREPDLGPAAEAERRAYLREHGWLASTLPMGRRDEAEHQIALPASAPHALALRVALLPEGRDARVEAWPEGVGDGCAALELVRGAVPARLHFQPEQWAWLRLIPDAS